MQAIDVVEFIHPDSTEWVEKQFWIQQTDTDTFEIGCDDLTSDSWSFMAVTREELTGIYWQLHNYLVNN